MLQQGEVPLDFVPVLQERQSALLATLRGGLTASVKGFTGVNEWRRPFGQCTLHKQKGPEKYSQTRAKWKGARKTSKVNHHHLPRFLTVTDTAFVALMAALTTT